MVNSATRWNVKMVILLATALAFGIGTVAACVVPWVYCKPTDDADDDRDGTPIRERNNSEQPNNNQNTPTSTAVEIHTRGLITIINPFSMNSRSTENRRSARSANTRDNAVTCNQDLSPNPTNVELECPTVHEEVQQDEILPHCSRVAVPSIAEVPNVAVSAMPNCIPNLVVANSMNGETRNPTGHQDIQLAQIPYCCSDNVVASISCKQNVANIAWTTMPNSIPNLVAANSMNGEARNSMVHQNRQRVQIPSHWSRPDVPIISNTPNVVWTTMPNLSPYSMNSQARFPIVHQQIEHNQILPHCSLQTLPSTPKVTNFPSLAGGTRNSEIISGDRDESVQTVQMMESRLPDPGSTELPSIVRIDHPSATNLQTTIKSSIATDQSSTESTAKTSGLGDSGSIIHTDERSAERTNPESAESQSKIERISMMESIASQPSSPRLTETEDLDRRQVNQMPKNTSRMLQTSNPSNLTNDSAIESSGMGSSSMGPSDNHMVILIEHLTRSLKSLDEDTSRRLQTSDPSNPTNDSAIESSEMGSPEHHVLILIEQLSQTLNSRRSQNTTRDGLKTISEVSPRSTSSREAAGGAILNQSRTSDRLPETSRGTSHPAHSNSFGDCLPGDERKRSRRGNVWSLSRFKTYIKEKTPRRFRKLGEVSLRESCIDSVHNLSAGTNLPAGNSTVLSDDQILQEIIRRRSMPLTMDFAKRFDARPVIQPDRELELSNQISSISDERTRYLLAPEKKTDNCISDFSREGFRDFNGSPRKRMGSQISQQGSTSRADFLGCNINSPKLMVADENHSLSANSSINDTNVTINEPEGYSNYSEKIDGKRRWRKWKNRITFRNKHRSKENNQVSSSGKRIIKNSDSFPVECQRNLAGIRSNSDENPNDCKVESTSVTPDAVFDYQRSPVEPCTEL